MSVLAHFLHCNIARDMLTCWQLQEASNARGVESLPALFDVG